MSAGLPGVHAMWSGADWTWHKPVKRNDVISTEAHLKDLVEHQTRFAGRAVQQTYHVDFFNQQGDLVAEADSWCFRTERDHAREQGTKYSAVKARPQRVYSEQELAEAYQLYADEKIRGSTPRYWQDVSEGEALPVMFKGPMTVTGFIAYAQGWGGLYIRANKLAWKQIDAHRGLGIPNRFGIPIVRSGCTGKRSSRSRSARPAPMITVRNAARGSPITSPTGWATTVFCAAPPARSAGTIPKATCCSSRAR